MFPTSDFNVCILYLRSRHLPCPIICSPMIFGSPANTITCAQENLLVQTILDNRFVSALFAVGGATAAVFRVHEQKSSARWCTCGAAGLVVVAVAAAVDTAAD